MNILTSPSNALIKHVIHLHDKSGREEHGECIVEGIRALTTFLEAGKKLKYLFITQQWSNKLPLLSSGSLYQITDFLMKKISTVTTPSGIVGVFEIPMPKKFVPHATTPPIVFAQISDPGNLGTLIRSAAAFNKKDIILVEGVDPWNSKVIQASAGTIAFVDLYYFSWQEVVALRQFSFHLGALIPKQGKDPQEIAYEKTILIIGNEAHGLPHNWQKECDVTITLPMPGGTESLNAAISGSIMMYLASQRS